MRRSTFLAGTTAASLSAFAPAAAQFRSTPYLRQLTIGVSVPLSGDLGAYGRQVADGVRAALDYTNRYAAPLAMAFGVREFDDQGTLAIALTNVEVAAADPSIVAVIGGLTDDVTYGTLAQYANVGMPLVVPTVTQDQITGRGYRNVWRLPPKDSTQGTLFARTVLPAAKPSFALAVSQDGDYGSDVAQGFVAQAKADHLRSDAYFFSVSKPDYAGAAKDIVAKHPDYVFLAGKTRDMGPLLPALRAAGYAGAFGAAEGFYNGEALSTYGKLLRGAWVGTPLPPLKRVPSDYQVLADLQRRVSAVTALTAYGYAAAQLLVAAIGRTSATTRLLLMQALQTPGAPYDTLVGSLSFTFTGDVSDPNLYLFSFGDGSFTYEKPAHPTGFVL